MSDRTGNFRFDRSKYFELLKDPRWQKKRLEILSRDNWTCLECGDKDRTLNVHHVFYVDGCPWATPDFGLRTLCEDCHEDASHIASKPDGIDQYMWALLCIGNELQRLGENSVDILHFGYLLSCHDKEEFKKLLEVMQGKDPS